MATNVTATRRRRTTAERPARSVLPVSISPVVAISVNGRTGTFAFQPSVKHRVGHRTWVQRCRTPRRMLWLDPRRHIRRQANAREDFPPNDRLDDRDLPTFLILCPHGYSVSYDS